MKAIPMDILLVEDNKAQALMLKNIFEVQDPAPSIHWVENGYDALDYLFRRNQYAASPRPNAIVLDLKLPRISGYQVLRELKASSDFASIPVIILSASLTPLDDLQCKALGADICLSKPSHLKGYDALVQRLCRLVVNEQKPEYKKSRSPHKEAAE